MPSIRGAFNRGISRRKIIGSVFVVTALAGWWLLPWIKFQWRFGAVVPLKASRATNVVAVSWPPPPDLPPTSSRRIREFFGCYYPEHVVRGNWFARFPKRLDDVLDEYGAQVRDGSLVDANGRTICFMKKWRSPSASWEWQNRHRDLVMKGWTVVVIDVEEDQDRGTHTQTE